MVRARPRKWHRARANLEDEADGEEPAFFPLGAEVEVRSDDPGFVGSFYEATVAGYQHSGRGYVVAYSTLTRRDDGGSPLRELAAAANVRPRPPPTPAPREFAMHEMVEAFHNDGWWAGVVCGVPVAPPAAEAAERPRRVYTVCFPSSREVLEFDETALRPRRVFQGERWVPAAEAENRSPLFREGSQVEVSGSAKTFGEYWNPAIVQRVIGAASFLVQYGHAREDGELATEILDSQYIRPARNIIRMDSKYRFPPCSHTEVFHEGSWWPGVILEVLDDKHIKKYAVKIKSRQTGMDDVECVDVLTVEYTQLRPRYDWDGKKWVRHLTERHVNIGPQLTSRKRPISVAFAPCNDSDEVAPSVPCNDSDKIAPSVPCSDRDGFRDESGSYLKDKVNNADVVLEPVCPDFLVCNENDQFKHKPNSYPEKTVRQQKSILAFESHLTLPSQPSVKEFGHLKHDTKICASGQLEQSSSRMIAMPSAPQTGRLQASLFGAFGQLRPLPQGPFSRIQSLNPGFGSIVGSQRAFTDQEKQSTEKGCYLMTGTKQNFNFGSFFETDLSRKRLKQNVSAKTPELLGENPEIMLKRKSTADKKVEGTNKGVPISEEHTEPNNDDSKGLPNDVTPGSLILSEVNTMTCIDSRPLKGDNGSQESSVFLRESSVADEIIPSGVPIGPDELHRGDYIGALQHGATKVSVLIEKSVLSITSTLNNPGYADVFSSNSSTQCGNKAANADKSALIMEQDTGEEYCQRSLVMDDDANVHFLPLVESCEDTGSHNMEVMVECARSCVVPTENVSSMLSGVAQNLTPSSDNCKDNKKADMGKADHQGNTSNMPKTQRASTDGLSSAISLPAFKDGIIITQSSTKKFAANEQHGVSQQDHSSSIVEYAAEGNQSIENSEITLLSSIDMSNSTEAEPGDTLIVQKDAEGTPMSKYVPTRTHGSYRSLLQRSLDVHESIIADRPSESLAIENLPFMKTSPMWTQIEAMEVFRKVPQRPRFHQFQQHVPELREGMALGLMLSFSNLAESIKRMSFQDDNALFQEKMKGLSSLEADGFDARHLRSRLEMLLHIKNGNVELQDAIKELEEKIALIETDDRQLGAKIGMLNLSIHQLELHASLFRHELQSAVSQKMKDTLEILRLKTEVRELERSYLSAEQRFSSAVAAPW